MIVRVVKLLSVSLLVLVAGACAGGSPSPVSEAPIAASPDSGPGAAAPAEPTTLRPGDDGAGPVADDVVISVDETPYEPVGVLMGELDRAYSSIDEIAGVSSVVILGRVVSTVVETHVNLPFTIATVEVEKAIAGGVDEGQTLTVVETGGVFAGRSKDDPAAKGTPVEAGFEGVPVMKPGERFLLFLTGPTHVGPIEDGAYGVMGAFQGKLRVGSDNRIAFTGDPARLDEPGFQIARAGRGRTVDAIIGEVEAALGN